MRLDSRPVVTHIFLYLRKSTKDDEKRQVRSIGDQRADCMVLAERLIPSCVEDDSSRLGKRDRAPELTRGKARVALERGTTCDGFLSLQVGMNLTVVDEFVESESASRPHIRPLFKSMLKELSYKDPKRRRAEGVLAWHPDRLSRNALEAGVVIQMLDDDQIKDLFFPAYNFHNDTSGKEHLTIEFARAKGYTDRLSDVVTRGVNGREKEVAMVYRIKYGYKKRREVPETPAKCSLFPIPHPQEYDIARRMFDLALSGHGVNEIRSRLADEFPDRRGHLPSLSTIDRELRDSFYYGDWVIQPGTKLERIVNLNEITLLDGYRFEPIITIADFSHLQRLRGEKRCLPTTREHRRVNPFPGLVHCATCRRKMYPTYRKIRRAGHSLEEQLGFECQTKHPGGTRCPQGRVKAEILYAEVDREITSAFPAMSKRDHQRYLFAMNAFISRKKRSAKEDRARNNRSLTAIRTERRKIIEQRAALVSADAYDTHSKAHYETRLTELAQSEENLTRERSTGGSDIDRKTVSFRRFLELLENLRQYWVSADPAKKGEISKLLFSNLTVEGKETRSVSWNPAIAGEENGRDLGVGWAQGVELEPWFERLWRALDENKNLVWANKSCAEAAPIEQRHDN